MSASDLAWLVQDRVDGVLQRLTVLGSVMDALQTLRGAAAQGAGWAEALKQLGAAVDANLRPAQIEAAAWQALSAEWAALKGRVDGPVIDALRPLTLKLSELGQNPLAFPLTVGADATGHAAPGGLVVTTGVQAGAAASVAFQVFGALPDEAADAGQPLPEGDCSVSLSVNGQLEAAAGATATPAWGSVSAGADASVSASLAWWFELPASCCVAEALALALPEMAAPGDLAGMLRACVSDASFQLCTTTLQGSLDIGGELEIGSSFVAEAAAPDATAGLGAVSLKADIGLKAGFTWGVAGAYRTVVRRVGNNAQVKAERTRSTAAGGPISLGVEFDVQGLQARLDPILQQVLPSSQALTSRLGGLSDLRGLALQSLQQKLGPAGGTWNDAANALLLRLSATDDQRQAAGAAFASTLAGKLDAVAKARLTGVQTEIDAASADVTALLTSTLGATPLGADAGALLGSVLEGIRASVDGAYAAFAAKARDAADDIALALAIPADGVGSFLNDLQARADSVTSALAQWIAKYEQLRMRIAQSIAQVERERLALSWTHDAQRERGTTSIVEVSFSTATPAACALYAAMRAGRLADYRALMDACVKEQSASEIQWALSEAQTRKSTDTLTFSFFGLSAIGATAVSMDRIAVSADSAGRILGASDSVHLEQVLAARRRLTQASLDLNLEMLAATGPGAVPLSSTFSASGDAFTLKDEADFFGLLTDAHAVGPDVAQQVRQLLWGSLTAESAALPNAELSVTFQPDDAGWARLLAIAPADLEIAVRTRCMSLLALAARRGDEQPWPDGPPQAWLETWKEEARLDENDFWRLARASQWSGMYNSLVRRLDQPLPTVPSAGQPRAPLQAGVKALWQIYRIGQGAADAWANIAQVNALLERLRIGSPAITREDAFGQLSDLSDRIRDGLSRVFTVTLADNAKPTKVNWQYLALIMTLADIANGDAPIELITKAQATIDGTQVAYLVV